MLQEIGMLQEMLKDNATKIGRDKDLLQIAQASGKIWYRRDYIDHQNLRLLLTFTLAEDANCIDIGAHKGAVLSEILRVAPYGKHIAYEPLPCLYAYLVDHFPLVDIRRAAVSDEIGERSFTYVKRDPAFSGFHERNFSAKQDIEKIMVRTEALDHNLPLGYIPRFIKIDVEGAERLVIDGAISILRNYKPIVVFEHGKGGAEYYNTQPSYIYKVFYNEVGLHIFDFDGNGPYTLSQFESTFVQNDYWNFFAC